MSDTSCVVAQECEQRKEAMADTIAALQKEVAQLRGMRDDNE